MDTARARPPRLLYLERVPRPLHAPLSLSGIPRKRRKNGMGFRSPEMSVLSNHERVRTRQSPWSMWCSRRRHRSVEPRHQQHWCAGRQAYRVGPHGPVSACAGASSSLESLSLVTVHALSSERACRASTNGIAWTRRRLLCRCMVIEDSLIGLQAAAGAEMPCIITHTGSTKDQVRAGNLHTGRHLSGHGLDSRVGC